ncbi:MAG: hypothetical protein IT168_04930 [Bryobacterales bacterium]|nr:hypothetical protein [Bryobacterales bacterium]
MTRKLLALALGAIGSTLTMWGSSKAEAEAAVASDVAQLRATLPQMSAAEVEQARLELERGIAEGRDKCNRFRADPACNGDPNDPRMRGGDPYSGVCGEGRLVCEVILPGYQQMLHILQSDGRGGGRNGGEPGRTTSAQALAIGAGIAGRTAPTLLEGWKRAREARDPSADEARIREVMKRGRRQNEQESEAIEQRRRGAAESARLAEQEFDRDLLRQLEPTGRGRRGATHPGEAFSGDEGESGEPRRTRTDSSAVSKTKDVRLPTMEEARQSPQRSVDEEDLLKRDGTLKPAYVNYRRELDSAACNAYVVVVMQSASLVGSSSLVRFAAQVSPLRKEQSAARCAEVSVPVRLVVRLPGGTVAEQTGEAKIQPQQGYGNTVVEVKVSRLDRYEHVLLSWELGDVTCGQCHTLDNCSELQRLRTEVIPARRREIARRTEALSEAAEMMAQTYRELADIHNEARLDSRAQLILIRLEKVASIIDVFASLTQPKFAEAPLVAAAAYKAFDHGADAVDAVKKLVEGESLLGWFALQVTNAAPEAIQIAGQRIKAGKRAWEAWQREGDREQLRAQLRDDMAETERQLRRLVAASDRDVDAMAALVRLEMSILNVCGATAGSKPIVNK